MYPNLTVLKVEFKTQINGDLLEKCTKDYFDTILKWGNFISDYSASKGMKRQLQLFQLDDEASFEIKIIDAKTVKIKIAFNEFDCYWSADWYLRWLSHSLPLLIKKVTFEWVL